MESDSTAYSLMSLQQDIPDELPSWDFAEDVLGGFDQFLDVSNFSQVDEGTFIVGREQAAAEPAGPSVSDADELELEPAHASRPSSSRNDPEGKKQRQNRQAQQRFRQRQRVRLGCTFTHVSLCSMHVYMLQYTRVLLYKSCQLHADRRALTAHR